MVGSMRWSCSGRVGSAKILLGLGSLSCTAEEAYATLGQSIPRFILARQFILSLNPPKTSLLCEAKYVALMPLTPIWKTQEAPFTFRVVYSPAKPKAAHRISNF